MFATVPWYADLGDPALFRTSCFSVVPETWFDSGGCNFTEKAIKTLSLHPLILIGDVGTLAALRAQGVQTFSPVFAERYDAEPDSGLRAEMVIAEIARLVRMPARCSSISASACPGRLNKDRAAELAPQPTSGRWR